MTHGRMADVVVLGSANMDLVVRQPRRAEPGETIFGTSFTTGPGGKGLNQAVACARAGAAVAFLGAVGEDDFGTRLRDRLAADHIDTAGLRTVAGETGTAHITVTDDGENTIVVVPAANADETFDDADRTRIAAASHLVLQGERPLELNRAAMRWARENGVTTVLTPAPVSAELDQLLELTDVLVPNEGEACVLAGEDSADAAAVVLSRRVPTVIVTLGPRGALIARAGSVVRHVAPRAVAAVDTTGAGDTFVGVLVAALAEGLGIDQAADAATAAASIAVTRHGAADAAPARDDIDRLLATAP